MDFIRTNVNGVLIVEGERFRDNRGFFSEHFREDTFSSNGIKGFVLDTVSESHSGVIRGLHWQSSPFSQGKLVTCLVGSIFDVVVDVRKESSTFGEHVAVELSALEPISLWIPAGFAHGFQALEDRTRVFYKLTNYWNKESERSLNPLDPQLGIQWPLRDWTLSERDAEAPNLSGLVS